tara:strand:- start:2448 stop:2975 length:528 start_codon:yes stop_codon:yes gene_type:complete
MFFNKSLKFVLKKKVFIIKCFKSSEVNRNYVNAINSNKFVRYNTNKKFSISDQKKYIKNINKSENDLIFGLFNKKRLVGTVGSQKITSKKYYIGVIIFNNKFRNLGLAKIMIQRVSKYMNSKLNVNFLFASVNKSNFISHKLFKSLNFRVHKKIKKKYKSDVVYYVNINKIKVRL